jgi:hypothetical protein
LLDGRRHAVAVVGDATAGGIVAVPAHVGVVRVEVGQLEFGDAARVAVDQQPGSALPQPARRRSGRHRVGHPACPAHHEYPVGDLVGGPRDVLLKLGVEVAWANRDGQRFFFRRAQQQLHGRGFSEAHHVGLRCGVSDWNVPG